MSVKRAAHKKVGRRPQWYPALPTSVKGVSVLKIRALPDPRAGAPALPRPPPVTGWLADARRGCHIGSMESFAARRRAEDRRRPDDRRRDVVRVPVEHRTGTDPRGGAQRRGRQGGDRVGCRAPPPRPDRGGTGGVGGERL